MINYQTENPNLNSGRSNSSLAKTTLAKAKWGRESGVRAQAVDSKPSVKQMRLRLVYLDPWTAVKFSFVIGVFLAIIGVVVVFLIWTVLNTSGVLKQASDTVTGLTDNSGSLAPYISLPSVMLFAVVTAVLGALITTIVGGLLASFYNLFVKITGGIRVGFTNN